MSDREFLLRVLSDGRWHSHTEIMEASFRERGCALTVHSRAADLRKHGHSVRVDLRRDGGRVTSFYRLLSTGVLNESAGPSPASDQRGADASLSLAPADSLSTPASSLAPDHHAAAGAPSGWDGVGVLTLFPTPQVGAYGDAA